MPGRTNVTIKSDVSLIVSPSQSAKWRRSLRFAHPAKKAGRTVGPRASVGFNKSHNDMRGVATSGNCVADERLPPLSPARDLIQINTQTIRIPSERVFDYHRVARTPPGTKEIVFPTAKRTGPPRVSRGPRFSLSTPISRSSRFQSLAARRQENSASKQVRDFANPQESELLEHRRPEPPQDGRRVDEARSPPRRRRSKIKFV